MDKRQRGPPRECQARQDLDPQCVVVIDHRSGGMLGFAVYAALSLVSGVQVSGAVHHCTTRVSYGRSRDVSYTCTIQLSHGSTTDVITRHRSLLRRSVHIARWGHASPR